MSDYHMNGYHPHWSFGNGSELFYNHSTGKYDEIFFLDFEKTKEIITSYFQLENDTIHKWRWTIKRYALRLISLYESISNLEGIKWAKELEIKYGC